MALRSNLAALAASFADAVLNAIRGASLEELLSESKGSAGRGRGPKNAPTTSMNGRVAARAAKPGRLKRRSAADIAKALEQVLALVKKSKAGMRSEEIRKALKLDVREVPRVLKEGLAKKKLKAKGNKRATTYTAG